ncbi:MAG: hemolysin family protein [Phycisphaerales bacterium]
MDRYGLWIAATSALATCYVGAVHYALHHFSRSKLEEVLGERRKSHRLSRLHEINTYVLLTSIIRTVLNLLILLGLIAFFAPPDRASSWLDLMYAFIITGAAISVFAVGIPHSWGTHAAESLVAGALPLLHAANVALKPLTSFLRVFDPLVRRMLGVPKVAPDDTTELEQEILDAVTEGEKTGLVDEQQKHMIEAVVEFGATTVDEIMTPRTDVAGIDVDSPFDQVKKRVQDQGHSRFPVYQDNLDHILGVLYVKDLLPFIGETRFVSGDASGGGAGPADVKPFDLRKIVRPALFVPESKSLRDLLEEMRRRKVHLALVLDEYGGTAGLVTIEDILEEIVGEIRDEYDPDQADEPEIVRVDERIADVDGRARIGDVNDALDIELPEDEDYDTLGGFVFATLGHIPEVGESFDYRNLRFTVTAAQRTKVNQVRLEQLDVEPAGENADSRENI